ncbi:hypothetical protein PV325_008395 [Microctonus aethiopoides]|nr:hypothetical protein PV325_008395 [Microctonus aethiopoides]
MYPILIHCLQQFYQKILKKDKLEASEIEKPTSKKNKVVEASCSGVKSTSSERNAKPVECSNKKIKSTVQNRCIELLQSFQEQQKSRDEKISKYLKNKENEIEKHEDWLNIESKKYKLLAKFLKTNSNSEDSDS